MSRRYFGIPILVLTSMLCNIYADTEVKRSRTHYMGVINTVGEGANLLPYSPTYGVRIQDGKNIFDYQFTTLYTTTHPAPATVFSRTHFGWSRFIPTAGFDELFYAGIGGNFSAVFPWFSLEEMKEKLENEKEPIDIPVQLGFEITPHIGCMIPLSSRCQVSVQAGLNLINARCSTIDQQTKEISTGISRYVTPTLLITFGIKDF